MHVGDTAQVVTAASASRLLYCCCLQHQAHCAHLTDFTLTTLLLFDTRAEGFDVLAGLGEPHMPHCRPEAMVWPLLATAHYAGLFAALACSTGAASASDVQHAGAECCTCSVQRHAWVYNSSKG